jgi:hypothetical protein
MKAPREPDLELRGKLVRSLGLLREVLPGSFVERHRRRIGRVLSRRGRRAWATIFFRRSQSAISNHRFTKWTASSNSHVSGWFSGPGRFRGRDHNQKLLQTPDRIRIRGSQRLGPVVAYVSLRFMASQMDSRVFSVAHTAA